MEVKNIRRDGLAVVQREMRETDLSEMYVYRERTKALLRRYFRLSLELGRVPSVMGRELFRSHVTSCRMHNFEDVVIFVYDIERCLEKLDKVSQQLIARIVLQEYTQEETAKLMGYTRRTVERRYPDALDQLTAILLDADLMRRSSAMDRSAALPPKKTVERVEACQEGERALIAVIR